MIVSELIQNAWRNSTLIDEEEAPTGSEASKGLRLFNSMLRMLNVNPWWPWTRTEIEFKLSGQSEYTIGNYNVDVGVVSFEGPNLYGVVVTDASSYNVGDYINVRLKQVPQVSNGDTALNWSCDILGIDGNEITIGLNDYDLSTGDEVYLASSGALPDIVAFRPSSLSALKYRIGNQWNPIHEVTKSTWDNEVITTSVIGSPNYYRFLPNTPYATIDLGSQTVGGYTAFVGYKNKVTEVGFDTALEEILPPEFISYFEYGLSAELLTTNNRKEPSYIFNEARSRKKQLMRNNVDIPVLETRNRWYYDYKAGINKRV